MIGSAMKPVFAYLSLCVAACLPIVPVVASAGNYVIAPSEAERRLGGEPFEILEAKRTASGVAGAQRWKLRFADGVEIKAKWKAAPRYLADGWNNSPRREIAAYEIQKWFLDEPDYIVPPSEVRCMPLAQMRKIDPAARPTILGTECVYGVLSLWLQDVEEPEEIWLPELFEQAGYYRYSIAAVDVLTLLIGHQDGRPANFLWSKDDRRQVFSIDNGISFHAFPYNFLVRNWNDLRVPALPRRMLERLDRVGPEQTAALGVMRHLEPDANGILRVTDADANLDPERGTRLRGTTLQFGLSRREIHEVEERLGRLLWMAESGEIPLF